MSEANSVETVFAFAELTADLATIVFFFFFLVHFFYFSGGWTDSLGGEALGFHQESLLPQRRI